MENRKLQIRQVQNFKKFFDTASLTHYYSEEACPATWLNKCFNKNVKKSGPETWRKKSF